MKISLYEFSKRENSSKQPTGGKSIDVYLKDNTSIYKPSFILHMEEIPYTYVKWDSRYYYIKDCKSIENGIWELDCDIDVLATWKSEIKATSAFVLYSTTSYNTDIPDTRLSTNKNPTISSSTAKLFDFFEDDYFYVLTYVSSQPNIGGSGVAVITQSNLQIIMNLLGDSDYTNYLENSLKSLMGVYDGVLSCLALPFAPDIVSVIDNVSICGYPTGVVGAKPNKVTEFNTSISIPWNFTDFRNRSQFTSLVLSIPSVGTVELNADDFNGRNSIDIKAVVDNLTGEVVVYIDNGLMKVTSNIGTPISIGTTKSNALGVVSGIVGMGTGLANGLLTGNYTGLESSTFNAISSSLQRSVGVIGSNGSYVNSYNYSSSTRGYVTLKVITHNTTTNPYSQLAVQGFPLNAITSLSSLSGYVKCVNASVNCNAPQEIKHKINSFLNGGMFIE